MARIKFTELYCTQKIRPACSLLKCGTAPMPEILYYSGFISPSHPVPRRSRNAASRRAILLFMSVHLLLIHISPSASMDKGFLVFPFFLPALAFPVVKYSSFPSSSGTSSRSSPKLQLLEPDTSKSSLLSRQEYVTRLLVSYFCGSLKNNVQAVGAGATQVMKRDYTGYHFISSVIHHTELLHRRCPPYILLSTITFRKIAKLLNHFTFVRRLLWIPTKSSPIQLKKEDNIS